MTSDVRSIVIEGQATMKQIKYFLTILIVFLSILSSFSAVGDVQEGSLHTVAILRGRQVAAGCPKGQTLLRLKNQTFKCIPQITGFK